MILDSLLGDTKPFFLIGFLEPSPQGVCILLAISLEEARDVNPWGRPPLPPRGHGRPLWTKEDAGCLVQQLKSVYKYITKKWDAFRHAEQRKR